MVPDSILPTGSPILITGANGFIGARVVETLLRNGFGDLRCFVRPSSRLERLAHVLQAHPAGSGVKLVQGDLLSRQACEAAAECVACIYHLAAGMEKSFSGAFMNSALAPRNLVEAFLDRGQPKRFVNVSSFAVYSTLGLKSGDVLDENCPVEGEPQARADAYRSEERRV